MQFLRESLSMTLSEWNIQDPIQYLASGNADNSTDSYQKF